MVTSRSRNDTTKVSDKAPRTPGPLGINDAADPNIRSAPGDTPGSLGIGDAAERIAKFRSGGTRKNPAAHKHVRSPQGYLIPDGSVKAMLPDRTWERARSRINELFKNAGGLQARYVSDTKITSNLSLVDGVVGIYLNSGQATWGFRRGVYNQLIGLRHTVPDLGARAHRFNKPDHYTVKEGRSFALKWLFQVSHYNPILVCVTYGAVSLTSAFAVWAGILKRRTMTTLQTIGKAPQAEQLSFGIALGNLIAHELRHQLALSRTGAGLGHSSSGLGMDEADFSNPNIDFADKDTIRTKLAQLRKAQLDYWWSLL